MTETKKIDCLFLMGMHRSGISALAGCLKLLGINFGDKDSDSIRETGHWEGNNIVLIHDTLLRDLGCKWDMIGNFPSGWADSEAASRARKSIRAAIRRRDKGIGIWAIKDPRLCRLMPLWKPILQEMDVNPAFILALRHPWEVAQSLQKRDGYDLYKGHLLWLVYNEEGQGFCQQKPYSLITYDWLLADPALALRDIEEQLGLVYPVPLQKQYRRILELVRPELKHHHLNGHLKEGIDRAGFKHFEWLYNQVYNHQVRGKLLQNETKEDAVPAALPLVNSPVSFYPHSFTLDNGTRAIESQSAKHGNQIFNNFLSVIGNFERTERDFKLQKEHRILSRTRIEDTLFARFYFPSSANKEYPEDLSNENLLPNDEWQLISFPIPDPVLIREKQSRFAPLNTRGMVFISAVKIVNAATGQICWCALKPGDFENCKIQGALKLPHKDLLALMVFRDDSQVLLPAIPDLPDSPLEVQVWIKVDTNQDFFESIWLQEGSKQQELKKDLEQVIQREEAIKRDLDEKENELLEKENKYDTALKESQADLDKIAKKAAAAASDLETRQERIAALEKTVAESLARRDKLEKKSVAAAHDLETRQERIATLEKNVAEGRAQRGELEKKAIVAARDLETRQERISALEQTVAESQAHLVELEKKTTTAARDLETRQERIATLEKNVAEGRAQRGELEKKAIVAARDLETRQERISALEQTVAESQAHLVELEKKTTTAARDLETRQERIVFLEKDVAENRTQRDKIEKKAATAARDLETRQERILALEKDVAESRVQRDELEKKAIIAARDLETRQERIAALEKNVAEGRAQRDELEKKAIVAARDLETRQERISALEQTVAESQAHLVELEKKTTTAARDLETRQEHIAALEKNVAEGRAQRDELEKKAIVAARDLETRQERIAALEKAVAESRAQRDEIEKKAATTAHELETRQERISTLEKTVAKFQEKQEVLEKKVAAADKEVNKQKAHSQFLKNMAEERHKLLEDSLADAQNCITALEQDKHELMTQVEELSSRGLFKKYFSVFPKILNPMRYFSAIFKSNRKRNSLKNPSNLFDSDWYLATYPEVAESGVEPLAHYFQFGSQEGFDPNPLFDNDWYLKTYPDVAESGTNPLLHYSKSGAQEGRDPNSLFDSDWYLETNLDVAASGINPLAHYLQFGKQEGRYPNPLFDSDWYLKIYPDVIESEINPLAHYLQFGVQEGRDPNPLFDSDWYLKTYSDVAASGINPLAHYLQFGVQEGRDPNPLFDSDWYLKTYSDVAASGVNPLAHYLQFGALEGCNPNPFFNGDWYLKTYPDVVALGMNPLAHYLHHGARENRAIAPPEPTVFKNRSGRGLYLSAPVNIPDTVLETSLNVLFVLHNYLSSNSGYQVYYYAERLSKIGANCILAVPDRQDDDEDLGQKMVCQVLAYKDIEKIGLSFNDGRGPDIVHAWTPREHVRKFCLKLEDQYSFKIIIHLEDNEEYLTEIATGKPWTDLKQLAVKELDDLVPNDRFHPIRGMDWLKTADSLTMIIGTLNSLNQGNLATFILPPPVDERLFYPRPINWELRKKLCIPDDHLVLVYTGNVHAANQEEVHNLYSAVKRLNQKGCPTTLIRTGRSQTSWVSGDPKKSNFVVNMGWVKRSELPDILAAADILVQPGKPGLFNDLRIPCKLPEYFAMGRPVILPKTNLGLNVTHERDAFVLETADTENIAVAVMKIVGDNELRDKLSDGAADFYLRQFNIGLTIARLKNYYHETVIKPAKISLRKDLPNSFRAVSPHLNEKISPEKVHYYKKRINVLKQRLKNIEKDNGMDSKEYEVYSVLLNEVQC